ncbi:BspA family leucine-rich repeat surface protein [Brochothrix thermosphacta]|uniref:BspA family leucine-rich repeat surface protein n=1 Tax=Brochothrix thermosphacta TaxID=2756 RepID=UPI0039AF2116
MKKYGYLLVSIAILSHPVIGVADDLNGNKTQTIETSDTLEEPKTDTKTKVSKKTTKKSKPELRSVGDAEVTYEGTVATVHAGILKQSILKKDTTKIFLEDGVTFKNNSNNLFNGLKELTTIEGLEKVDTSNVTSMSSMFNDCSSLTTLDVSNFDTSNVTNMSAMFSGCSSLTILDVSNFDTSNVTNMSTMFSGCSSLTTLDVSNFDTSNVTNMQYMFNECSPLTILDVSNFDTSNVTYMQYMFNECSSLTTLDVSNFDTSNVISMEYMFDKCSSLTTLDVSNFNTSNVTYTPNMLTNLTSLTKIKFGENNQFNNIHTIFTSGPGDWAYEDDVLNNVLPRESYTDYKLIRFVSDNISEPTTFIKNYEVGKIIVKYQDVDGNTISDDSSLTGKLWEEYTSEQLTIEGYSFKEVQGTPTGKFTDKEQIVTYIYTKNEVPTEPGTTEPGTTESGTSDTESSSNTENNSNKPNGFLPQTGEEYLAWLSGLGIALIGVAGLVFYKRRK